MLKKIIFPVLFLFLSSCGFEAIHSKKNVVNYNFFISELTTNGNRDVNIKIREKLINYILNETAEQLGKLNFLVVNNTMFSLNNFYVYVMMAIKLMDNNLLLPQY